MLLLPAVGNATGGGVRAYEDHLCTVPSAFTCLIAWLFRHSAYAAMTESQGKWAALKRATHTFISTQEHVGTSQVVFSAFPQEHIQALGNGCLTGHWQQVPISLLHIPGLQPALPCADHMDLIAEQSRRKWQQISEHYISLFAFSSSGLKILKGIGKNVPYCSLSITVCAQEVDSAEGPSPHAYPKQPLSYCYHWRQEKTFKITKMAGKWCLVAFWFFSVSFQIQKLEGTFWPSP